MRARRPTARSADSLREVRPRRRRARRRGRGAVRLFASASLGADIDLDGTYGWGWEELVRIEAEMVPECRRIGRATTSRRPSNGSKPSDLVIEGEDKLRAWLQQLMDTTIDTLDGTHFEIPEPVKRVEAMIAPAGGAAAMYYTGPSEDFSRPGRTWYPTLGKTRFPLWGEVSIAYHEGVPGHHLQVGQVWFLRDRLDRFSAPRVSGYIEGWALYAERLMDESATSSEPVPPGHLRAQAMRAVRVIVDIGMHLEMAIPPGQPFHPGDRWTPELGQQFVDERSRFPLDFMASEIVRYLGWPGQAISYKVGERVWLAGRPKARCGWECVRPQGLPRLRLGPGASGPRPTRRGAGTLWGMNPSRLGRVIAARSRSCVRDSSVRAPGATRPRGRPRRRSRSGKRESTVWICSRVLEGWSIHTLDAEDYRPRPENNCRDANGVYDERGTPTRVLSDPGLRRRDRHGGSRRVPVRRRPRTTPTRCW